VVGIFLRVDIRLRSEFSTAGEVVGVLEDSPTILATSFGSNGWAFRSSSMQKIADCVGTALL